jgi:site-specific DNA recombinase
MNVTSGRIVPAARRPSQSFRILSQTHTAFVSLSEHIDYSTPEGMLQLTILAAFAAYFSDMLSKHTSKGKGERAAQGLYNGDVPFGDRLFTIDTINAITRCEFYAAFEPGDDRGTVMYKDQRFRGQHPAAFTYEEWQRIRIGTRLNYKAPQRSEQAHRTYEFSGYIVCVHCGLNLRCRGASANVDYSYYKDMAKARQLPCPAGGYLQVRTDLVIAQFGDLLQGLKLPTYWRDMVRESMLEAAKKTGLDLEAMEMEKERLRLKRGRILKQHREGYIDDEEFQGEMAAVELALRRLDVPEVNGVRLEDVIQAGERLPGMAALWSVATVEERRDMVTHILEPGGLHYDVEMKEIAAITPRPDFLPVLRLLEGVVEYEEATGTLVTRRWQQRNRRASASLSPVLILFVAPHGKLFQRLLALEHVLGSLPPLPATQEHPDPREPQHAIPEEKWPDVMRRVREHHESLRQIAAEYGVSHETVRRLLRASDKESTG